MLLNLENVKELTLAINGSFPCWKGKVSEGGGWGAALEEKMTCLNVIRMHGGSEIIH